MISINGEISAPLRATQTATPKGFVCAVNKYLGIDYACVKFIEGTLHASDKVRVIHEATNIFDGNIKFIIKVNNRSEYDICVEDFNDFKVGDIIELM